MELNDALRIPLAPSDVWDALQDLALLRASLDNCESFTRLGDGEYALTMTVPLGPLRARYEARAHIAGQDSGPADAQRRTINFKARAEGIGSLRGQIEVRLRADDGSHGIGRERGTRIDYTIWATSSGPLAELPTRPPLAATRAPPGGGARDAAAARLFAADHAWRHRPTDPHGSWQCADRAGGKRVARGIPRCVAWGLASRVQSACGSELGVGGDDFSGGAAVVCGALD
jgi:carbon monoxide dehydrogenase subunit G